MPIVESDKIIGDLSLANAMLMVGLNMIGEPSTVLFRKSDFEDQRPAFFNFDGAYGRGVIDMVMWTALLLKGDAVYFTEPLSAFRIHPGQRQHHPTVAQRNLDSIRELQAAWLALGLDRRRPPLADDAAVSDDGGHRLDRSAGSLVQAAAELTRAVGPPRSHEGIARCPREGAVSLSGRPFARTHHRNASGGPITGVLIGAAAPTRITTALPPGF